MRFIYLFLVLLLCFAGSECQDRQRCRPFKEFQCFWDGDCIPISQMCDGKHDCSEGEDETEWFAGCKNCSENQFHCHKEQDFLSCIKKDYLCDGFNDCFNGEDETYEFTGCKKKCKKDSEKAKREGRQCKKSCKKNKDCRPKGCKPDEDCYKKQCLCDHECGMSCVTVTKTCPKLTTFSNLRTIRYVHHDRKTHKVVDAEEPYTYNVYAYHKCEPGYEAYPSDVRMCHGRGDEPWTREVVCAKTCSKMNDKEIKRYNITCGETCRVDADCPEGRNCTCDGPCGRSCVSLDVECGDAPPAENAYVEYTGEKFDRVAHYLCEDGYYTHGGDTSRKCTGSGKYEGMPIVCKPVTCADPVTSVIKMGGRVINYQSPPYYFNTTFQFACGLGQRLLGSSERTCMGDGKWSGLLTVCDNKGPLERCPHPGIPVGGELLDHPTDEDFVIGKWVTFRCDEGMVMVGRAEQECLFIKEWSGDGAPRCVDPRYSDSPTEVINKLKASTDNVRPLGSPARGGRTIRLDTGGKIEVYFVIDLSLSVKPGPLKNTINFAQALVRRLSLNDTGRVSYGIVVFATKADVMLDLIKEPHKSAEDVIKLLGEIERDVDNIRKKIKYGTDISDALELLNFKMIGNSYQADPDKIIKRHIVVITDGAKNAGGEPIDSRLDIENAYADNPPEFYSITSSARGKDHLAREQLLKIASKEDNFVYVDDFYKLHIYVDQITDVREDYTPCGQAGEVGSVRKIISRGRTIGGEDAVERAWPWQVLITIYDQNILAAYLDVIGGGSLINDKWVLSAAHVFDGYGGIGWESQFMLSMGIVRRPHKINMIQGSVKIYQPEKIYLHDKYLIYDGKPVIGTFQNDVALVKIGGEFTITEDGRFVMMPETFPGMVEFSPYIRPVCLPCSPDSCVTKLLMKEDSKGEVLLKGDETPEEKCQIEYEFLMGKNKEGVTAVVATGFGHNSSRTDDDDGWIVATETLQQAVLQIQDREKCEEAVNVITRQKSIKDFKHIFTEQMFCAVGSDENQKGKRIVDTCKGDSGGPLTREVRDDETKESCFVQLGIVSWGYGCGQVTFVRGERFFYPGFYTDVTSVMTWIDKTMAEHENSEKKT